VSVKGQNFQAAWDGGECQMRADTGGEASSPFTAPSSSHFPSPLNTRYQGEVTVPGARAWKKVQKGAAFLKGTGAGGARRQQGPFKVC